MTDRPDMTSTVYHGVKQQIKSNQDTFDCNTNKNSENLVSLQKIIKNYFRPLEVRLLLLDNCKQYDYSCYSIRDSK